MEQTKLTEVTMTQGENISALQSTVAVMKDHLDEKHCDFEKRCDARMDAHEHRISRLEKNDEREMMLIQTVAEMQGNVNTMQIQFEASQQKTDARFADIQTNITAILNDKEESRKAAASNRAQNWRLLLAGAIGFGFAMIEFIISRG